MNTFPITHTPIIEHEKYAIIADHHADSAAYEALIGGVHQIFEAHSKKKYPQEKTDKILQYIVETFGERNGEEFVYLSDSTPSRLEKYHKRPAIVLPDFDSVTKTLEEELAQKVIDVIELHERVLTTKEKENIKKAVGAILRAAKKMKKLLENRPVWDYKALADSQARLYKQPHILAREAAEILDIDPLEHFQEEIIELARLYPKVIKPEKIYGDRWFEFLKKKGIDPKTLEPIEAKPKFKQVLREVEKELKERGVPEEQIYAELEKKGIPKELAKIILDVRAAETVPTSQIRRIVEKHVDRDPKKAKAVLEAMERTGKLVPVPKYWANIVSKIATGEIKENELLEALAVSKHFQSAYATAIAKASKMDEPESVMQKMAAVKRILEEAHRETLEGLKKHPVYGEHIARKEHEITSEVKSVAEALSKTLYAKSRSDPSLSLSKFMLEGLCPTVETLASIRPHLKRVQEDFLAVSNPQEETIKLAYPEIVSNLTRLGTSPFAEKEYLGITHKHEIIRRMAKEVTG